MEDRFAVLSPDLKLAYQVFGDAPGPPFLLITGWFSDLTLWPAGFCARLSSLGYTVIRYDNRDSGLSTRTKTGSIDPTNPPYTMSDLAADAVGLLDFLGVLKAHIAGFAMGGTIAQYVAIEHPERVLSLTPMATASGAPGYPMPDPDIRNIFAEPFPDDPAALAAHHRKLFAAMAGSSFDGAEYEEQRRESTGRGAPLPNGALLSAANRTSGDRTARLSQVSAPVLVVHAELDPLVSLQASKVHTAAYPNARLLILEGIGHGVLPSRCWDTLAQAMDAVARAATGRRTR